MASITFSPSLSVSALTPASTPLSASVSALSAKQVKEAFVQDLSGGEIHEPALVLAVSV
ncbi:hypothetical protein HK100_009072, partial [Physocladia obscura]